jgi:hypothetical protein
MLQMLDAAFALPFTTCLSPTVLYPSPSPMLVNQLRTE